MTNRRQKRGDRIGFSLIEVNLAILMIGLGLLVVFSLFPAALREGESAFVDTHAALFSGTVLEGLRGKAGSMTWTEWQNKSLFAVPAGAGTVAESPTVAGPIQFPAGSGNYVHYIMKIYGDPTERTRGVAFWAWSGKYAPNDIEIFKNRAEWSYSRYYFSGAE